MVTIQQPFDLIKSQIAQIDKLFNPSLSADINIYFLSKSYLTSICVNLRPNFLFTFLRVI